MEFSRKEKEEKIEKPIPSYRSKLPSDRRVLFGFCERLKAWGASYYTMRDRIVYGTTKFEKWELRGVKELMNEFDPEYEGSVSDYFQSLGRNKRSRFVSFMKEHGGMSRSSCYHRFRMGKFAEWEMKGLWKCEEEYLLESEN